MRKRRSDPSVLGEPHLRAGPHVPDPSEARAARVLDKARASADAEDQRVEHTVWDEPGLSPELAGQAPPAQLTYSRWLEKRRGEVSGARSWGVTLALALAAGPWAVLGAFYGSGQTAFSLIVIVLIGPTVEEVMKTAAAMYVIERRPFLFKSPVQIAVCVVAGALVFATLENLLYLNVYVPQPPVWLVRWRWSVCVALHVGCTLVAGLGLMRIWRDTWERRARPRLVLGFPYLVTAIVIHGTYNALAVVLTFVQQRL